MNTQKRPYELLVRWDTEGALAGAHAQFRYVTTTPDGAVLGEFLGPAEAVALTAEEAAVIAALPARIAPAP